MNVPLILNVAVALAVCFALYRMQAAHLSFTKRVFTGLGLGVLLPDHITLPKVLTE